MKKTLRDEIAMCALPALLSELYDHSIRKNVKLDIFPAASVAAYELADMMMVARDAPPPSQAINKESSE